MTKYIIGSLLLSLLFVSCTSRIKPTSKEATQKTVPSKTDSPFVAKHTDTLVKTSKPDTSGIYRLVVTFASKGSGIDFKTKEALDRYQEQFQDKYKLVINKDSYNWGREGEVDFCFRLENLKPALQQEFIYGVQELLKNNTLIFMEENTVCRHKR